MTPLETLLTAIRARLEAATPGPWQILADEVKLMIHAQAIPIGVSKERIRSPYPHDPTNVADFQLIAHAPTDLAKLLAIVEDLRLCVEQGLYVGSFDAGQMLEFQQYCERTLEQVEAIAAEGELS